MAKKPEYKWNEEKGYTSCCLYYKDLCFCGDAVCHPDDQDMKSKLTGMTIAEGRAIKKFLQHIREYELKPQLAILKQLYYSMNRSKHFNPKSYENIMLQRQIRFIKNQIDAINEEIAKVTKNIKNYIDDKEKSYAIIRKYKAEHQDKDN